jgi:alpha-N-arabinofuranosidase
MKKPRLPVTQSIIRAFPVLVCLSIATYCFGQSGANLLTNGDFEVVQGGSAAGWVSDPALTSQGSAMVVTNQGTNWLVLSPNSTNSASDRDAPIFGEAQGLLAANLLGASLYVSASMSAAAGSTAVMRVYVGYMNDAITYQEVRVSGPTSSPVLRRDVVRVPNDPQVAFLVVLCGVEGRSGTVGFSHVQLTTVVPSSWLEANGVPDIGPAYTAQTAIDAAAVIRSIPSTLYGSNLEWPISGNGAWNTAGNAPNPFVGALSKQAGVTLHRFPGGVFADYYHWQSGVGPQSQRPVVAAEPGGFSAVNDFGTDEALEFAQSTNGQLLITVNIVTASAQDAANWVAHVNQGGHRVQYWEIGNENYMPAGSAVTSNETMSPEVYANRFLQFAEAMRAVDPSISIGAIVDFNFSHSVTRAYPYWTQRVLAIASGQIDFLAVHCGYAPVLFDDKQWSARTVYAATLAAPVLIAQNLKDLAAVVSSMAPLRNIPIAVTEWGPLFQFSPQGRFVDHPKTLASALVTASTLKAFVESPQTSIANFFKLIDTSGQGAIGFLNDLPAAKPSLMALQMFSQHFGSELVRSSTQGPIYDSPAVGWVDAVTSAPYLDIVSSTSPDGKTLYIISINKHFNRSIETSITLSNFAPKASASVFTLSGTAPDANTGTVWIPYFLATPQAGIGPDSRINMGSPNEVSITESAFSGASQSFSYTFTPCSITSIVLTSQ